MSFEVSKATPADAEELHSILEEGRTFKSSLGDDAWGSDPFTAKEVVETISRGNTYIAEVDGQPAGSIVLIWSDERVWGPERGIDNSAGYVHRLAVRDNFHGQRVGEQLLGWASEQAKANRRSVLRLDCRPDNEKLCAYYENQGFKRVGTANLEDHTAALYERSV